MNEKQKELAEAIQAAMDAVDKVAKLTPQAFPPGAQVFWQHGNHHRYATARESSPAYAKIEADLGVHLATGRGDWQSLRGIYRAMFGYEFTYRRSDGK